MFDGYKFTDFMDALERWDLFNKRAKCVYMEKVYEFDVATEWRKDFAPLNGGMILDGIWYTEI